MFCNPPYSKRKKDKPGQEDWIEKAYKESSENGATVVMLIPARTDTIAFHEYILGKAQEIRFVKGRLKFEIDRKANKEAAPFPSMIVIFRGSSTTKTNVEENNNAIIRKTKMIFVLLFVITKPPLKNFLYVKIIYL